MNNGFNLFGKAKEESRGYKYSYFIHALNSDETEEINDCNLYMSYKEELTGDYILREKQGECGSEVQKKDIIYVNAKTQQAEDVLGFTMAPELTTEVRRNSTRVARLTYFDLLDMVDTYQSLAAMAKTRDVEVIQNLTSQTRILSAVMLKIYQQLSNSNRIPRRTDPAGQLPKNYCAAIDITGERLDKVSKDLFRLRRLVDINNINRQLFIMQSIVENQFNTLNNLRKNCMN